MLHKFLSAKRNELIERCKVKVSQRSPPKSIETLHSHGIPRFLDQLIETLQAAPDRRKEVSGAPDNGAKSALSEMGISAAQHGRELSRQGYTVEQVIRDYGDLCQAITDAAFERNHSIALEELLNIHDCLDHAIADSVT